MIDCAKQCCCWNYPTQVPETGNTRKSHCGHCAPNLKEQCGRDNTTSWRLRIYSNIPLVELRRYFRPAYFYQLDTVSRAPTRSSRYDKFIASVLHLNLISSGSTFHPRIHALPGTQVQSPSRTWLDVEAQSTPNMVGSSRSEVQETWTCVCLESTVICLRRGSVT